MFANRGAAPEPLTYDEFRAEVDAGNVESAEFLLGDGVIEGELSDGDTFRVAYVEATEDVAQELRESGVEVSVDPQKGSAAWPSRPSGSGSCSSSSP